MNRNPKIIGTKRLLVPVEKGDVSIFRILYFDNGHVALGTTIGEASPYGFLPLRESRNVGEGDLPKEILEEVFARGKGTVENSI